MIAPMVDILLVVLVFFIVTWNFALSENELDVRVPTATKANEAQPYVGQVVINITANGSVVVNRQQKSLQELLELLKKLSQLYPDQAVIVRGDQAVDYKHIVDVLDICQKLRQPKRYQRFRRVRNNTNPHVFGPPTRLQSLCAQRGPGGIPKASRCKNGASSDRPACG